MDKNEFMKKCVSHFVTSGKAQDQAVAICISKFDKNDLSLEALSVDPNVMQPTNDPNAVKPPPPLKTKVDMIPEIKKLLQKNNMNIDDATLLALIEKIQVQGMSMKARLEILELQQIKPIEDNQDILALPFGKHYVVTKNFEGWIDFNEKLFKNIIENYNNGNLSKPYIDINHARDQSCGLLSNPRIEGDGLHIDFKLNELGLDLVRKGVYNYISPTITDFKDGQGKTVKDWLATISLVNSPALLGAVPMLSEQLALSLNLNTKRKKTMSDIMLQNSFTKLVELSTKFGKPIMLAGDITPEAAAAAMPDIIDLITKLNDMITKLTGDNAQANQDAQVAKDTANAANQQLTAMIKKDTEKEMEIVIKEAVQLGIYHPVIVEMKRKDFMENPQKIKDEIKMLKTTVKGNVQMTSVGIEGIELSQEDFLIAKQAGYDLTKQEDIEKFKKLKEEK
jgi:outer membrane murein-binding lipoprotein Lpp